MTHYNLDKHHRRSIRLKDYDYSKAGMYFITICTGNREHFFGKIKDRVMYFSPVGAIADILWYDLKNRVKGIDLGQYVIMPNHMHGIIIIENDRELPVGALHATPLPVIPQTPPIIPQSMASISPKSGELGTIIRSYKSAVTKHAHRLGFNFSWQRNYYEHIIRNDNSYRRISNYIHENPIKWGDDRFYNHGTP